MNLVTQQLKFFFNDVDGKKYFRIKCIAYFFVCLFVDFAVNLR